MAGGANSGGGGEHEGGDGLEHGRHWSDVSWGDAGLTEANWARALGQAPAAMDQAVAGAAGNAGAAAARRADEAHHGESLFGEVHRYFADKFAEGEPAHHGEADQPAGAEPTSENLPGGNLWRPAAGSFAAMAGAASPALEPAYKPVFEAVSTTMAAHGLTRPAEAVEPVAAPLGAVVAHVEEPAYGAEPAVEAEHGAHHEAVQHTDPHADDAALGPVGLSEEDRLPWLESGYGEEEYPKLDTRRIIMAGVGALAVMLAVVGGVWWFTHRAADKAPSPDGSLLAGPSAPFKVAPTEPGGKKFAGTDDTSYAVSMGKTRQAQLGTPAGEDDKPHAMAAAPVAAADKPATQEDATGKGLVQIAAYGSRKLAEAGWDKLSTAHAMLKDQPHRIVEAVIDNGTVYRLQLLTKAGGGASLCAKITAEGMDCQVKH
jgi:hypothetical protein